VQGFFPESIPGAPDSDFAWASATYPAVFFALLRCCTIVRVRLLRETDNRQSYALVWRRPHEVNIWKKSINDIASRRRLGDSSTMNSNVQATGSKRVAPLKCKSDTELQQADLQTGAGEVVIDKCTLL
jgi:hypothetical protein